MTDALKLRIYFGDSHLTGAELTSDALMDSIARHGVAASALCRGIEGFGLNRRIHTQRFPDISTDLPLVAWAVDSPVRIRALLDDVDRVVADGLVTLEQARLAAGARVADAEFPPGQGGAGELTVYCGRREQARGARRPAHRQVVEILRRYGAAGATTFLGVDGTHHGRRRRATFLSPKRDAPLAIVSMGRRETLAAALPVLSEALERPLVTLQTVAHVKHDGERLEDLPTAPDLGPGGLAVWQAVGVYTRQSARAGGRTVYTELTRRLREAGAAGVTIVRGYWGFSSDEPPGGDRFARVGGHSPIHATYLDHPGKVAEVWPIIDELTAEHGIVTSLITPPWTRTSPPGPS